MSFAQFSPPDKPLTIGIIGAGQRGTLYASYAKYYPKLLKVVAVADHHHYRRNPIAKEHDIPQKNIFKDWKEMASLPKLCDAVAICTQDQIHCEPTIAFANLKYDILLEKPMAVTLNDCFNIHEAVTRNNVIFGVGHVLRYTDYFHTIKKLLQTNVIGDIVNIQHTEPVGFWHFAHSFVRGNWNKESTSTFSLMSKSCHDLDILQFLMDSKCTKISSFGTLKHFNKANKPKEALSAIRCLDCPYEPSCQFSAKKHYIQPFMQGHITWPVDVVQPNGSIDIENLTEALKTGDYGRCVYEIDNDVCDNQIVNMEFQNGATASFTMIAFTEAICQRKTVIYGTKGELTGDSTNLILFDFLTQQRKKVEIEKFVEDRNYEGPSGHGGGDFGLMASFVKACITREQKKYLTSGPTDTLDSHICVFAAEESRKKGNVINVEEFKETHLFMKNLNKPKDQKLETNV